MVEILVNFHSDVTTVTKQLTFSWYKCVKVLRKFAYQAKQRGLKLWCKKVIRDHTDPLSNVNLWKLGLKRLMDIYSW